jgi:signal transduction protein with GAF and PtsI domain
VVNLRTQAAYVADVLAQLKNDVSWKQNVEETIKRVQTAGNALEQKVGGMEEHALHVHIDLKEKIQALKTKELE